MFRKNLALCSFSIAVFFCSYLRAEAIAKSFIFPVAKSSYFVSRSSQLSATGYYIEQYHNTTCAQGYCSKNYQVNTTSALCSASGGTWQYGHNGIDLNDMAGGDSDCYAPVYAAANGRVVYHQHSGSGWGNMVRIKHSTYLGNRYTNYAHLDSISVNNGQDVVIGQQIGTIGKTGNAGNVCHLHFHIGTTNSSGNGYYYSAGVPSTFLDPISFIENFAYSYDNNGHACLGPVTGGWATGWEYTCNNPATTYTAGDDIFALFRLDDISFDHRYKVKAFRNNVFQWEWTTDWNYVGSGWEYGYFWPAVYDATAGNWRFDAYVDTGGGFISAPFGSVSFTVNAGMQYFSYNGNGTTCEGPVTGDVYTNWVYTCQNPETTFSSGNDVYGLINISGIPRSHQFRVMAFRDQVLEYDWATDWNIIPLGGWWNYAYFWPVAENAKAGDWSFYIFVRTTENNQRYTLIKQLDFEVF